MSDICVDLDPTDYPFDINIYLRDTDTMVFHETVRGPGMLAVPVLHEPVDVEIITPRGTRLRKGTA